MSRSLRQVLAWASFLGFTFLGIIMGSISGGMLVLSILLPLFGVSPEQAPPWWGILLILVAVLSGLVGGMYLCYILWLVFSRLWLSRVEAAQIAFFGSTSTSDRKLFDRIFPPE